MKKPGYKIALWLISLTDKLAEYYGVRVPRRNVVIEYEHHSPIKLQNQSLISRWAKENEIEMVKNKMKYELLKSAEEFITFTVLADDLYNESYALQATLTLYKKNG